MTREELLNKIKEADKAYYDDDNPIMTDVEYDKLVIEYTEKYGDKDLDYVGGNVKIGFKKFKHPIPLLSLAKVYDDDENILSKLDSFLEKCNGEVSIQRKIDGLTIASYFIVGEDFTGYEFCTRGKGGLVGEVLPNFIYDSSLRNKMDISVRGEAYITEENFEKIIKLQEKNNEKLFSNPRNAAAGILRNLEKSPYLDYISYTVYEYLMSSLKPSEQLKKLREETSFNVIDSLDKKCKDSKELLQDIRNFYDELINNDNIPFDGVVIKMNVTKTEDTLFGSTKHHPNDALAWKRVADKYEVKVTDVVWELGREKVTPVVNFEPTEMDGTIVRQATLHNLGFFKKLDISKGDIISVCKSGEIIPKVLSVAKRNGGEKLIAPEKCPICGEDLETRVNGDISELSCTNENCSGKLVNNIAFLASKDVLDIPGLSDKTAELLVSKDKVKYIYDIFNLTLEDIKALPGFKDKKAQNLYNAIQNTKEKDTPIRRAIKACCISGIGNNVGELLENKYKTIFNITIHLNKKDLKEIKGIGDKSVEALCSEEFLKRLLILNEILNIKEIREEVKEEPKEKLALSDTKWCITGKFEQLNKTKEEIADIIRDLGGVVESSVKKDTDYLLVNDINTVSTKAMKAKKYGVKLVTFDFIVGASMA